MCYTEINLDIPLQAIWYEAYGNWNTAHNLIQDENDQIGAWAYAYLHCQEEDDWSTNYWYLRANRVMPNQTLPQE